MEVPFVCMITQLPHDIDVYFNVYEKVGASQKIVP